MSTETAPQNPACSKCRTHRVRCDRVQPHCGRCTRLGHDCTYPDKSSVATAYVTYIEGLEAEIALLEDQLRSDHETRKGEEGLTREAKEGGDDDDDAQGPTAPPDSIITDLFAHPSYRDTQQDSRMRRLVDELGQVSLSAMTASQGSMASHNSVLRTLIMSAAAPPDRVEYPRPSHPEIGPGLPAFEIAEQVCLRYCSDVLPEMPVLAPLDVQLHLHRAYTEHNHYSLFLISIILATTAMSLTPSSVDKACTSFHLLALRSLEASYLGPRRSANDDPLLELEVACLLGHFAYLAGSRHADAWALSGVAIRIAVDHGLQESCDSSRSAGLFWSAYILDRKLAVRESLPLGIPEAAVRTLPPADLPIVPLYRTMSAAYMARVECREPSWALVHEQSLEHWQQVHTVMRQPSVWLSQDIEIARSLIQDNP